MSPGPGKKLLFATSNGTGLGHLNRALAIARRLPAEHEAVFLTLSQAAPVVLEAGFRVEYHASYRRPGSGSDWQWNRRLRRRLERLLEAEQPDLVVFDGVHPYRALTHVLSAPGAPRSVWSRRAMWRPGSSTAPLRRTGSFDLVLEPGELAAAADAGATAPRRDEVVGVDPIVYLDAGELLARERAADELGVDPDRPAALVNLGQGGEVDRAVGAVLERLGAEPGLQVAALQSSIGAGIEVPAGVIRLEATFPMSRYFRAFDLAVAAAGYNAFHELIAFAVPTLFVPMPRQTDDQVARARWADRRGLALAASGPGDPELAVRLEPLLDSAVRDRLAAACGQAFPGNGAHRAAELVAGLAAGEELPVTVRDGNPLRRWLHSSSHPIGPSLPLALGLTARDLLRHPERRRPLAIVEALAVPPEELGEALRAAIGSLDVPARRVLVITDSLDFATLRELGVAVHRIPAAAELGLEPDDEAYGQLLADRYELALAPWRGRWPLRRLGLRAGPGAVESAEVEA